MRDSTRRELMKLRELVHFLLSGAGATPRAPEALTAKDHTRGRLMCFFCLEPLDAYGGGFVKHGNAVGPKFAAKLSIHHVDGDHDNNVDFNKALCHTSCHKAHHRREANLKRERMRLT